MSGENIILFPAAHAEEIADIPGMDQEAFKSRILERLITRLFCLGYLNA